VNHDDPNANLVQNSNLLHKRLCSGGVREDFAAGLEDEYLAFEKANIGCCVFERRHNNGAILIGGHD
jgi:hypothetical protein